MDLESFKLMMNLTSAEYIQSRLVLYDLVKVWVTLSKQIFPKQMALISYNTSGSSVPSVQIIGFLKFLVLTLRQVYSRADYHSQSQG